MSERQKSRNDEAWEALFQRYAILEQIEAEGHYTISAAQIKEYREPRLMAKFDHKINLPQIFADHGLAILPISRGDYVISHFKAYQPFECLESAVEQAFLPPQLQSLNPGSIPSETIAINCAFASGMLSDFLGEDTLYPTVSGRMGSSCFSFEIDNTATGSADTVMVEQSQIEIDAAFEGAESLALLEAKRDLSEDFLIRQLYYPFRTWSGRVSKRVRPIFLVYSNGVFSLYEYSFRTFDSYNSLVLVNQKNYSIDDTTIELPDLLHVLKHTQVLSEPEIAFPQADSFQRVINLCELLLSQDLSREKVTEEYAFDIRQTNYYSDAARYLGLVEKYTRNHRKPAYRLSAKGRQIMVLRYKQRQLAFCECILQHRVFQEVFKRCMACGCMPNRNEIIYIMKCCNLFRIGSESTFARRSSTINGWLNWMLGLLQT